ncbi:hypothetical protein N658DRAFT_176115 [Parathielavia hyrcaniae]|uniref:Uncharacterized protein n=1 Tax=Parathielavia hyrcaniae TaxID=113614 RepID=A0AAN6Q8Y5_9PEZI|nr:hypothetical protein N658DRAFT_176115 [Parathielavia hyrcaniae]
MIWADRAATRRCHVPAVQIPSRVTATREGHWLKHPHVLRRSTDNRGSRWKHWRAAIGIGQDPVRRQSMATIIRILVISSAELHDVVRVRTELMDSTAVPRVLARSGQDVPRQVAPYRCIQRPCAPWPTVYWSRRPMNCALVAGQTRNGNNGRGQTRNGNNWRGQPLTAIYRAAVAFRLALSLAQKGALSAQLRAILRRDRSCVFECPAVKNQRNLSTTARSLASLVPPSPAWPSPVRTSTGVVVTTN